jgi:WD40 repeat protein
MAISDDGEVLTTGGDEPCAWNTRDGQLIRRLKLSSRAKPWQGLAFLPGTQEIVAADGNGLLHWLPKTDSTPALLLTADVNRVGVSSDGRVITGTGQKGVYLIRPSGKLIARWLTDHPPILAACASDTLIGVASAGNDRLVRVGIGGLNVARYREIACSTEVRSLSFNKDGSIAAGLTKEGIRVWSVPDGRTLYEFDKMQDGQQRPTFSPCGQFLAVNSSTGAKVYDLRTGKLSTDLKAPPDKPIRFISGDVAFSPDGELLAAANTYVINVWRIRTGELIHSLLPDEPTKRVGYWSITVAFSPDGRNLATGSGTWYTGGPDTKGGITKIWDVGTGELLCQLPAQLDGIYGLAWSPDGKWLATGSGIYQRSDRAAVKVWDARTGDLVYNLRGHTECVWNVAFSPDGRRLTSASGPCTVYNRRKDAPDHSEIRIWDMTTGLELLTLHDSGSTDYATTFSQDGRWFGTAGANGIIRLWEMEPVPESVRTPSTR